ncbi:MAG: hypothetical protein EBT51_09130 [Flavobacteriaceae bacterium]|nr:hypothetical protein [Flavobacteriaceae bacterium]
MNDKQKKAIARKSLNYTAGLKKAIHSGDLEGVIKSVMLLAVKHNTEQDWRMSPRTFMELCQVLIKYRETFGSDEGFGEILELLEGGQD